MGLLTSIVTLPLAPVRGTIWIAEVLLEEVERQQRDPEVVEQQLLEAEAAYERGDLTEEEFAEIEDERRRVVQVMQQPVRLVVQDGFAVDVSDADR